MKHKIPVWIIVSLFVFCASACLPFAVTLPGGYELPSIEKQNDLSNLLVNLVDGLDDGVGKSRSCPEGTSIWPVASGQITSESRNVGQFHEIALVGMGEVFIQQGEPSKLGIQADERFLPFIETWVDGDQLILAIREDVCIMQSELAIQYFITIEDLSLLHIVGAGVVQVDELRVDKLRIQLDGSAMVNLSELEADALITDLNGTGSVQVRGTTRHQVVNLNGVGDYLAGDLESLSADVKLNGTGNLQIWAISELQAELNGLGTVGYYGKPELQTATTGVGEIKRLGSR